jgi:hypothetical protein
MMVVKREERPIDQEVTHDIGTLSPLDKSAAE